MAYWIKPDITNNYFDAYSSFIVNNDLEYISEVFAELGLGSPEISNCEITQMTHIADIMDKFNAVEQNIDRLHECVNYPDIYYAAPFRWGYDTNMYKYLYNGVMRWYNWLIDAEKHCSKSDFETAYLTDKYGNFITDKNGRKIKIYKEW